MGTVWSLEDERAREEDLLFDLFGGKPEDVEGFENFKHDTRAQYDKLVGEGKIHKNYFFADEINVPKECVNSINTARTNYHNALWGWADLVNYDNYLVSLKQHN